MPTQRTTIQQNCKAVTAAHVLTLSCADRPGLVDAVAGLLSSHGGNILDAQQFDDLATNRFFMRVVFAVDNATAFRADFATLATKHTMHWTLRAMAERRKVLLLVSKFDHCLGDLLYRYRIGELTMGQFETFVGCSWQAKGRPILTAD